MPTDRNDQEQQRGAAPEGLRRDQHQEEQERLSPRIGALRPEDEERAAQEDGGEPPVGRSSEGE